jgi:hypothetical protein
MLFGRLDLTCHFHEGARMLRAGSLAHAGCEKPPLCGTFASDVGVYYRITVTVHLTSNRAK